MYTLDTVTPNQAMWSELTASIVSMPDIKMIEIGSFEGRSAKWWLDNVLIHETSKLYCIDVWDNLAAETIFDLVVKDDQRVTKLKLESRRALQRFFDQSIDMIYIDGSHNACDVCLDALLSLPLLKIGGILLFDDCEELSKDDFDDLPPTPGINAFLSIVGARVNVIRSGQQIAMRKLKHSLYEDYHGSPASD